MKSGDLPDYTCAEKLLGGQKGGGGHPIVSDVNLPIGLFAKNPSWLRDVHTGEDPEINQIRILNQAKQDDCPKETRKKCPIKVIQTATRAQLPGPARVSGHTYGTLFSPNKHFTC